MTKREALKLALEVLEYFSDTATLNMDKAMSEDAITAIKEALAQPEQEPCCYGGIAHDCRADENCRIVKRMKATQPEPWEKFCDSNCVWTDHHPDCKLAEQEQHQDWCASLTQMLMSMPPKPAPCNCKPKPEQEPVAAESKFDSEKTWSRCSIEHHNWVQSEPEKWPQYQTRLLYTTPPQPQQESKTGKPYIDGLIDRLLMSPPAMTASDLWKLHDECANMLHLMASPPQRKPLTDEEISAHWESRTAGDRHMFAFARSIEAAHGIIAPTELKGEA